MPSCSFRTYRPLCCAQLPIDGATPMMITDDAGVSFRRCESPMTSAALLPLAREACSTPE